MMEIYQWTSLIILPLSGSGLPEKYLYEIGGLSQILWLRATTSLT